MPVFHRPSSAWSGRDDHEDGEEARRFYHYQADKGRRAILGFACDIGVARNKGRKGAFHAPPAIRQSLAGLAAPAGLHEFSDFGDIIVEGADLEAGQQELGRRVGEVLLEHDRVLILGGGHETAYGSYLGLKKAFPRQRIGIINLDAHLDLRNVGEAGPSSGTPFNQIREMDPAQFDYLCLGVAAEANTQALFLRASEWGVRIISDVQLNEDPYAGDGEIDALIDRNDVIYLTIDIDVLPHYQAPGVSAPATRGVRFDSVERVLKYILETASTREKKIPLADIVEVSPPLDDHGMTVRSAAFLAAHILSA